MDTPAPALQALVLRNCIVINHWTDKLSHYGLTQSDLPYFPEGMRCDIFVSEEGKISKIVKSSLTVPAEDSREVDLNGAYVMPGLIDSHVHHPPGNTSKLFRLLHLLHGVTSTRELAGAPAHIGPQKEAIAVEQGSLCGPRSFYVGQALDGANVAVLGSAKVRTVEAAEKEVSRRHKNGCFGVKVFNNIDSEVLNAVVNRAEERGLAVIGHCPQSTTVESSGIHDVQHLTGVPEMPSGAWGDDKAAFQAWLKAWECVDEVRIRQLSEHARRVGQVHTPTLALYYHSLHESEEIVNGGISTESLGISVGHCKECGSSQRSPVPCWGSESPSLAPHCCTVSYAKEFLPRFMYECVWKPESLLEPYYRCMCTKVRNLFPQAFPRMLYAVQKLHENGVILHAGSDCITPYVIPGRALHEELMLFQQAGMNNVEAFASATSLPGTFLSTLGRYQANEQNDGRIQKRISQDQSKLKWLGFIVEGAPADLIVSASDPRVNLPAALSNLQYVICGGRCYAIDDIKRRVQAFIPWCQSNLTNSILPVVAKPLRMVATRFLG